MCLELCKDYPRWTSLRQGACPLFSAEVLTDSSSLAGTAELVGKTARISLGLSLLQLTGERVGMVMGKDRGCYRGKKNKVVGKDGKASGKEGGWIPNLMLEAMTLKLNSGTVW